MSVTEQIKSQVLCDGAGHAGRVDFFWYCFHINTAACGSACNSVACVNAHTGACSATLVVTRAGKPTLAPASPPGN